MMSTGRATEVAASVESLEPRRHLASAGNFPQTFGGAGFDSANRTVPTPDGGYIVAGIFSGTTNFAGPGQSIRARRNPFALTARGDTDIFVVKYNASSQAEWVKQIGGDFSDNSGREFKKRDLPIKPSRIGAFVGVVGSDPRALGEYANDIAVDRAGNVYLAGAFLQTISIGNTTKTADQTFDDKFYDALVVKFAPDGAVAWSRQFGGVFNDNAQSIAVDREGNPYVAGYYSRQMDVDPSSDVRLLSTRGRDAGFVLKMTPGGALGWDYQFDSKSVSLDERNSVNDIAVTPRGEVYLVGTFGDTADFQPGKGAFELDSAGRNDAFLARLNRRGGLIWAVSTGGKESDGSNAVALGADGSVYTAGYFGDKADVDPRPGVVKTFTPAVPADSKAKVSEFTDILVSRFTIDAAPVWQAQMGGAFWETVTDIQTAPDGSVYTVGSFFDTADFAPGKSRFTLTSLSVSTNDESIRDTNTSFGRRQTYDFYVSRLSPRGKFVSAASFGGQDDDFAGGISVLNNGQLLLSGRAVTPRGPRDDRQEQSLIYLLEADLKRSRVV